MFRSVSKYAPLLDLSSPTQCCATPQDWEPLQRILRDAARAHVAPGSSSLDDIAARVG
jgi:hypothetical protein